MQPPFVIDKFKGINRLVDACRLSAGEMQTLKGASIKTGSIEALAVPGVRSQPTVPGAFESWAGVRCYIKTNEDDSVVWGEKAWAIPPVSPYGVVTGTGADTQNVVGIPLNTDSILVTLGGPETALRQFTIFFLTQIVSTTDYRGSQASIIAELWQAGPSGPTVGTGTKLADSITNTVLEFDKIGAYACDYTRVWRGFTFNPVAADKVGSGDIYVLLYGQGATAANFTSGVQVWSTGAAYAVDAVVRDPNGSVYECTTGVTATLDPSDDDVNWAPLTGASSFPEFSTSPTYGIGTEVWLEVYGHLKYQGTSWFGTGVTEQYVAAGAWKATYQSKIAGNHNHALPVMSADQVNQYSVFYPNYVSELTSARGGNSTLIYGRQSEPAFTEGFNSAGFLKYARAIAVSGVENDYWRMIALSPALTRPWDPVQPAAPTWDIKAPYIPTDIVVSPANNNYYVCVTGVTTKSPANDCAPTSGAHWALADSGASMQMLLFGHPGVADRVYGGAPIYAHSSGSWVDYPTKYPDKNYPQMVVVTHQNFVSGAWVEEDSSFDQIGTARLPFNSWTGLVQIQSAVLGIIDSSSLASWGGGSLCTLERTTDDGTLYRAVLVNSDGPKGDVLHWVGTLGPAGPAQVSVYPYTTLVRNGCILSASALGGTSYLPLTLIDDFQAVNCDYQAATFNSFLALTGGGTDGATNAFTELGLPQANNKAPCYIDFRYGLEDLSTRRTRITIKAFQKVGDQYSPGPLAPSGAVSVSPTDTIVDLPDYPAFVTSFGGSLIYANGRNGVGEYWSTMPNTATFFSFFQFASQTEQIRNMKSWESNLLFLLESKIVRFNGVPNAEQLTPLANFGLLNSRLICETPVGLFLAGSTGFYLFNGALQLLPDRPKIIFDEQSELSSFGIQPFQVTQVRHVPEVHSVAVGLVVPNGLNADNTARLFYKLLLYDYYLQDWYEHSFVADATAGEPAGACAAVGEALESLYVYDVPTSGNVSGLIFKGGTYQEVEVVTGLIEVDPTHSHKKFLQLETDVTPTEASAVLSLTIETDAGDIIPVKTHDMSLTQAGEPASGLYSTFRDEIGVTARWIKITATVPASPSQTKIHRFKIFFADASK